MSLHTGAFDIFQAADLTYALTTGTIKRISKISKTVDIETASITLDLHRGSLSPKIIFPDSPDIKTRYYLKTIEDKVIVNLVVDCVTHVNLYPEKIVDIGATFDLITRIDFIKGLVFWENFSAYLIKINPLLEMLKTGRNIK